MDNNILHTLYFSKMTSRTHDLAALTALNIIILTNPLPAMTFSTAIASAVACFMGGLAPDIDEPTSEFWRKIPAGSIIGRLTQPFLGAHRHLSHSLLGIVLFGAGAYYLLGLLKNTILVNMDIVWVGFMIGLISHPIMDSLTTDGVPWFFPIDIHFGFPPFKFLRMKTGGILEKCLIFPGLLFVNFYLFYKFYLFYIDLFKRFIK